MSLISLNAEIARVRVVDHVTTGPIGTPASGYAYLYVVDNRLYVMADDGVQRPASVLRTGNAASRPATPWDVGDVYYSKDTKELNLVTNAGLNWETFDLSDLDNTSSVGYVKRNGSLAMTGEFNTDAHAIIFAEQAAPITPAADHYKLYAKDGGLYVINEVGVETGPLGTGGGGGGVTSGARLTGPDLLVSLSANDSGALDFDTEVYDTDGYADLGSSPDRMTIPSTFGGMFVVTVIAYCQTSEAATNGGPVQLNDSVSGGANAFIPAGVASGYEFQITHTFHRNLTDSALIIGNLYNLSDTDFNILGTSMTLTRLGATLS